MKTNIKYMLTVKSDQGPNCHTSEHYSAQVCNTAVWDYGSTLKPAKRLLTDMAERHQREYQCTPPVSFFPFTLKVTLAEGWTGLSSRNIKCKTLFFNLEERQTDYTNTHTHTYFASTHMQQRVLPIPLSSSHTRSPPLSSGSGSHLPGWHVKTVIFRHTSPAVCWLSPRCWGDRERVSGEQGAHPSPALLPHCDY